MTSTRMRNAKAVLLGVVVVVTALLLVMVLGSGASDQPDPGDAGTLTNRAVVDRALTADVVDAVTAGIEKTFAYDYRAPDRTERAAADFYTGDAEKEYAELYAAIAEPGAEQQLVFASTVTSVGVRELTQDRAEVLVFLMQHAHRDTDGGVNQGPAQFRAMLDKEEGTWRLSKIDVL